MNEACHRTYRNTNVGFKGVTMEADVLMIPINVFHIDFDMPMVKRDWYPSLYQAFKLH